MGGLAALQPGQVVVVSGHITAPGELVATRIAQRTSGGDFLLRGLIAASDPAASRFQIGGLDVLRPGEHRPAGFSDREPGNWRPGPGRANGAPLGALRKPLSSRSFRELWKLQRTPTLN
ncbi:MAG: hypothetical protein MZV70_42920 [Desulfobacterales bacterium]|nr:hypothetical protein [Desulfobacterales bacterium]